MTGRVSERAELGRALTDDDEVGLNKDEGAGVFSSARMAWSRLATYIAGKTMTMTNKTLTTPALAGATMTGAMAGNSQEFSGHKAAINAQTGTSYTTTDDDMGKIITLDNASAITLTVHDDAAVGFHCGIIQLGAGQVTVAAEGSGTLRNRSGHTKLAGQYAMGGIIVPEGSTAAPEVYLTGDTAA